jgi:hypothetical protein
MDVLYRIKHRLLKSRSESKQPCDSKQSTLCQRCENLQLSTHVERPWKISTHLSRTVNIAVISKSSITSSCTLCRQFTVFLQLPALVPSSYDDAQYQSFILQLHHVLRKDGYSMTQFSIYFQTAGRQLRLVPTYPMVFRSLTPENMPLRTWDGWPADMRARVSSDPYFHPFLLDYDRIKTWIDTCRVNHHSSCELRQRNIITRPNRVIDCQQRKLCASTEAYVCLSYVWGSGATDLADLGQTLPHHLPQTVSDAMAITLNIGLRYLWVDRYCIDQSNVDEKHNVIQNMNAICKFLLNTSSLILAIYSQHKVRTIFFEGSISTL